MMESVQIWLAQWLSLAFLTLPIDPLPIFSAGESVVNIERDIHSRNAMMEALKIQEKIWSEDVSFYICVIEFQMAE